MQGLVSTNNSTTTTLTANSTFTGDSDDAKDFSVVTITAFADVASASNGLSVEWSTDNTNWDITDTVTVPAGSGVYFVFACKARYFRIVYTNGSSNQGSFRLQSIFRDAATPNQQANQVLGTGGGEGLVLAGGYAPDSPACTFTRPANTTAYTAGDEVGTSGTSPTAITIARFDGATGVIQGARCYYSSYPSPLPQLALLVFKDTVTLAGDNAQLNLSDADAKKLVCVIPLLARQSTVYSGGVPSSTGGVVLSGAPDRPAPHFKAGAAVQTFYFCLITLSDFTPIAASETLDVEIDVEQN